VRSTATQYQREPERARSEKSALNKKIPRCCMFAKPNWGDLCVFLPGIGLLHDEIVIGTGPDSKGGDTVVRKTAVVSTMSLYLSPETVWANRRFFQTEPQKPACCFLISLQEPIDPLWDRVQARYVNNRQNASFPLPSL
jgi:hypothetical protein